MSAAIFSLQLSVPGIRRGTLHGGGKVPITIINFGVLTIITMSHAHVQAFQQMLEQGVSAEQLIIERAPAVRLHKKRAEAKARKQAQEDFRDRADYWKKCYEQANAKAADLQQKVFKMQTTIETLAGMRKDS